MSCSAKTTNPPGCICRYTHKSDPMCPYEQPISKTIVIPDLHPDQRGYRLSAERIAELVLEYVRYRDKDGRIPRPYLDCISALSELAALRKSATDACHQFDGGGIGHRTTRCRECGRPYLEHQ